MGPLSDYPAALPNRLYVSSALTAPGLREGLEHMGRARARGEGFHLCSHRESSTLGTDLSTWLLEGPPHIPAHNPSPTLCKKAIGFPG